MSFHRAVTWCYRTWPAISAASPPPSAAEHYKKVTPGATLRGRDEILRFFAGLELVEPGLIQVPYWRRTSPNRRMPTRCGFSVQSGASPAWRQQREGDGSNHIETIIAGHLL